MTTDAILVVVKREKICWECQSESCRSACFEDGYGQHILFEIIYSNVFVFKYLTDNQLKTTKHWMTEQRKDTKETMIQMFSVETMRLDNHIRHLHT